MSSLTVYHQSSPEVPNKVLTNAMVYVPEAAVAELADLAERHREALEQGKDIKKPADKSVLPVAEVEAVLRSRNGVINLCPDKPAVFREIARVLKPGGRMQVGDILVHKPVPQEAKDDIELWTG